MAGATEIPPLVKFQLTSEQRAQLTPIFEMLVDEPGKGYGVLIMAPELNSKIDLVMMAYARWLPKRKADALAREMNNL